MAVAVPIGVLKNPLIVAGPTPSIIANLGDFLARANADVVMEMFGTSDAAVGLAVKRVVKGGGTALAHLDAQMAAEGLAQLPLGTRISLHGSMATKLHTKIATVDGGERAWLGTAPSVVDHWLRNSTDIAVSYGGDAAHATRELTVSAISGQADAVRAAADEAARLGVYINDPLHGVRHLRHRMLDLIDNARRRIYISTKYIGDMSVARHLADAQKRGVVVVIDSAGGADKKVQRWRDFGLDLRIIEGDHRWSHGNVILADTPRGDEMYIGTAHLTKRAMARKSANRMSREAGVIVAGAGLIHDTLAAISGPNMRAMAMADSVDNWGGIARRRRFGFGS